jgi:hypothetical protein
MKLITYPQNSGVGVIIPSDPSLTIEEIAARDVPEGVSHLIVETLDVSDIYDGYLSAYYYEDEVGPVVNIDRAKALHLDKFREARAPKLSRLDVDYMKAVETFNAGEQAVIFAKKQELRDVTQTELPNTLEEIKAVWPSCLDS